MTDAAKPTKGPWAIGTAMTGPTTPGIGSFFCGGEKWPYTAVTRGWESIAVCPQQDGIPGSDKSNAALIAEAGTVYHETGLTPRQLAEHRDELLAALAPFAAFAGHLPAKRKFGNRPTSGVVYSMASHGIPDAEFTVEQVHAAAALLAKHAACVAG